MVNTFEKIIVVDYPELKLLCWDCHSETITRKHAFSLYTNRWGHVIEDQIVAHEKRLINSLTKEYGRGYFFPRAHGRARITTEFLEVTISENDIDQNLLDEFVSQIEDLSYPGRRNGIQYFWKEDYQAFLISK